MPNISSVNFGRWLDRLGQKYTDQPPIHQSVQPVAIAQDQRDLVSPAIGNRALIGALGISVGANFNVFAGRAPGPIWIRDFQVASNAARAWLVTVADQSSAIPFPTIVGGTVLVPNPQRSGAQFLSQWTIGEMVAGPPVAQGGWIKSAVSTSARIGDFFVPAGGFFSVEIQGAGAGQEMYVFLDFTELPNENAQ